MSRQSSHGKLFIPHREGDLTMMRLDGKVTLITGVSQYMGTTFTKTFTDAGAIVVTQDRSRAEVEPHAEYAKRNPGGGRIIEAGLTRTKDVETMFGTIDEQFGRIDILVSNYGIVGSIPFDEIDDERVNDMFEQNFFSFCRVTRSAVTRMKGQGGGKIVAITGLAGITGTATLLTPIVDAVSSAYLSVYAASRGRRTHGSRRSVWSWRRSTSTSMPSPKRTSTTT
jgi:NAD(P)-dependent dehydrogenase (short-subunit alcohol dehydrogenase family)